MKKKTIRSILSFALTASVLLAAPGYTAWAGNMAQENPDGGNEKITNIETTEELPLEELQEERYRDLPKDPVHHCTKANDGTDYTDWSYIYFGSYPQTEVTGNELTEAITGASYDASGDALVDGVKYRRISKSDTKGNVYFGNSDYRYFKWERIKWRVLKNDGSTLFVMADKGMDCQRYNDTGDPYGEHDNCTSESATWEECTLRDWLNNTFYTTAFNSAEQGAVMVQTVVNEDNSEYKTDGGNTTTDNVYLLSIGEVTNPSYGFCEFVKGSASRMVQASAYSQVMGAHSPESPEDDYWCWWLRSPGYNDYNILYTSLWGDISTYGNGNECEYYAIVPALHIDLSSELWSIADDKINDDSQGGNTGDNQGGTTGGTTGDSQGGNTGGNQGGTTGGTAGDSQGGNTGDNQGGTTGGTAGDSQEVKIQKISLSSDSTKIAPGKKVSLTLSILPRNAANQKITWETDNKKYATVNSKGVVTTKKAGKGKTVKITAKANDGSGQKAVCKIKIMKNAVTKVSIKKVSKTLKAGKSMKLSATVKTNGKNANKTLKWTVSNKKYATVNAKGKVTAKKAGKGKNVTVTATSTDGTNKKAKVKIKIK